MADGRVSIAHLPAEVLLLIFKIYSMLDWRGGDVPWIKATHVCRAWRETALSSAALWSYIRLGLSTSLDRVATWLERSQQAPLTVVSLFTFSVRRNPQGKEINELIVKQLGRIREIEIYLPNATAFQQVGKTSYPHLKQLVIHATVDGPHAAKFTLLTQLDHTFPNLTTLELTNFSLDIGMARVPASLTSLHLSEAIPATHATAEQVLDILRGLPLLEEFVIGRGKLLDEPPSSPTSTPSSNVKLPHLRLLSITEHIHPCVYLLTHLTVPKGIHFNLNIQVTSASIPYIGSTAAPLIANWVKQVSLPWRSACFEVELLSEAAGMDTGLPDSITFTASSIADARTLSTIHQEGLSKIVLEESDPGVEGFWEDDYLDALYSALDYSSVKTLVVSALDEKQDLSTTFSKFHKLEALYITGSSLGEPTNFLAFLDQRHNHEQPLSFPELKTLVLHGLYFEEYDNEETDQTRLQDILIDRARWGSTLGRLAIARCKGVAVEDFSGFSDITEVGQANKEELKIVYGSLERSVDELAVREGIQQLTPPF